MVLSKYLLLLHLDYEPFEFVRRIVIEMLSWAAIQPISDGDILKMAEQQTNEAWEIYKRAKNRTV